MCHLKKKRKLEDAVDGNTHTKPLSMDCPEIESIVCGRILFDLHIDFAQQILKKQFPKLSQHFINIKSK